MGWPSFDPITLLMPQNKQDRRHSASTSSSGPTCDIRLQATQSTKEIENIKPTKIKHHKACKQQTNTRSQAVARIADRTASQHLWGSRDVIGCVTIWYPICRFLLVVLWNGVYLQPFSRLRSKRIGSRGHVTSSVTWPLMTVTWPFDTPYAISYRCSFGTNLSVTVSDIFDIKCNAMTWPWYDLWTKVKVIHFSTNRFLIYDIL